MRRRERINRRLTVEEERLLLFSLDKGVEAMIHRMKENMQRTRRTKGDKVEYDDLQKRLNILLKLYNAVSVGAHVNLDTAEVVIAKAAYDEM